MIEAIKSAENALKRANRFIKNGAEPKYAWAFVRNEYNDLKSLENDVELDYRERFFKIKLQIEKTFNKPLLDC